MSPSGEVRDRLLAVVGPTASGKTGLAVGLAEAVGGELINADSRQAIAELAVGVCKPSTAELRGIRCHGLDWRQLGQPYNAAIFAERARETIEAIWAVGRVPILVGGTGLYLRGLLRGFDFGRLPAPAAPAGDAAALLTHLDPGAGERVDLRNPRRAERALALALAGRRAAAHSPGWGALQLGVQVERAELRRRISIRADRIVGPALAEEVGRLRGEGWADELLASSAIGYREALLWLDGHIPRDEAVARLAARTWRYARAQMTWWAREPEVSWVAAPAEAGAKVSGFLGLEPAVAP